MSGDVRNVISGVSLPQLSTSNRSARRRASPMRIGASGDTVWLLDVIAGDRKAATAVLANFRQLSGERAVKIHPIVARLVEEEVLAKLIATNNGAGAGVQQG